MMPDPPPPPPPPTPPRTSVTRSLLLVSEVARIFRVDPRSVRRWAEAGELGAVRTPSGKSWRFSAAAVHAVVPAGAELLRPVEVARLFRVNRRAVDDWAVAGKVPGIRTPGGHWRLLAAPIREHLAGRPASTENQQETGEPRPIPAVVALDPNSHPAIETRGVR